MVRHPSEQSSTFRSVTYAWLNVRGPFEVWCKHYAKVLVLSHSLNRVAIDDQWSVICFSYIKQLCFFRGQTSVPTQSQLLSIVRRSLECRGVCHSCDPRLERYVTKHSEVIVQFELFSLRSNSPVLSETYVDGQLKLSPSKWDPNAEK